ncbi:MAG: Asp-tRNA(Asn)/Glu-tRNA(Gln) amidotransferase subunit GatC [Patescibacteria group bacterium]
MITDKEIEHIAQLTRIKLGDKEKEKFKNELSSILGYVKKLNELNTDGIEPIYQVTGLVNALRADEHRNDFEINEKLNEKLVGQAPRSENRFVKIKSVFQKS